MKTGPCDVEVRDATGVLFYGQLTGAEAVARLKKDAGKGLRLSVRPWQASAQDHEDLRVHQERLIKMGMGLAPI